MRTMFFLIFMFILGASGMAFALPLELVPGPSAQADNAAPIAPGAQSVAPGNPSAPGPLSSSSVPAKDPLLTSAHANTGVAKLPKFPVEMYVRRGTTTRFELFFLNVKYGYALSDFQFYNAWCLRKDAPLPGQTIHIVRLYNSSDPNLPPEYKRMAWRPINYLINHPKGSREDMQQAIWRLAQSPQPRTISPEAARLLHEANLKGKDYTPATGDLAAIICQPMAQQQPLFIEYKIPAGKPPVVKAAFFPAPLTSVEGFASRLIVPPFYVPLSGGTSTAKRSGSAAPEPSSLLLLTTALLSGLLAATIGKRFQVFA